VFFLSITYEITAIKPAGRLNLFLAKAHLRADAILL
jgi:hypothetical protein